MAGKKFKAMSEIAEGNQGNNSATDSSGTSNYTSKKSSKMGSTHSGKPMKNGGNEDYHGLAAHKHMGK